MTQIEALQGQLKELRERVADVEQRLEMFRSGYLAVIDAGERLEDRVGRLEQARESRLILQAGMA